MIWLLWFLVGFALVMLVVRESIFEWPRRFLFNLLGEKLGGWLACGPCAAFWVGVAVGVPDPAAFATWVPTVLLSTPWAVTLTAHLLGGLILLGAVRLVQTFSHSTLAIIAEEAAEKERHERAMQIAAGSALEYARVVDEIADDVPDGLGHA